MSADVESNFPTTRTTRTTRTWSWTTSSPELPTTSSTPMSSSSTIASTPSLSTPLPLLPSTPLFDPSPPPSPSSPPSISASPTMTTTTSNVPTTSIPSTVTPTTTVPTTTISITITPTITITTTTSISTPTTSPELFPTIPPITTTTTTVIPPTTSVGPTTSASASTPITSSMTSRSSSTDPGRPLTSTTPITPVVSTLLTGSTPEAMLSSPTRLGPMSTFSSTVYISTTDSHGLTTVYTPSFFTTTMTFMTGGTTTTSIGTFANPTLNTDDSTQSSFFQNKGAVAGVFTLVGIAVISIIIWIILFIRRKRRENRREYDPDLLTSLFIEHTPLDPDTSTSSLNSRYEPPLAIPMANSNPEGYGRSSSGVLGNNSRRRTIMPDAYHERGQYDPNIEYGPRTSRDRYRDIPSPTTPHLNIPPSAFAPYRSSSDGMGMFEVGTGLPMGAGIVHTRHSHHSSGSSFEPLLASHQRRNSLMPGRGPLVLDATNLSNGRASRTPSTDNVSSASTSKPSYLPSLTHPNFYATNTSSHSAILINGQEDHSSEVNLVMNGEIEKQRDILVDSEVSTTEDEHELQKPVLAVRNLPDAASTLSLS